MIIIPIVIQCTNVNFKSKINKETKRFPFDWMISTPKSVFEILDLLLNKNMNINELVENHFLMLIKK